MLTLKRIAQTPGFTSGSQVKVSHAAVAMTQLSTNVAVRSNWLLERLFDWAAIGVPWPHPPWRAVALTRPTGPAPRRAYHRLEKNISARAVPLELPARSL